MNGHTLPPPPDLGRILRDLPRGEAEGLREAWSLAALAAPEADDDAIDEEAVARTERLLAALAGPDGTAPSAGDAFGVGHPETIRTRAADRPPHLRRYASVYRGVAWPIGLATVVVAALLWMRAPVTYEAPPSRVLDVRLPDGSTVTLNSGTTLRRARLFDGPLGSRSVQLEGEAFFDVAEDEDPFVVRTFDATITVLGTSFGVRAWPDDPDPATTVALLSGRVRFEGGASEAAVVLAPGEVGRVEGTTPTATSGATEDALAWRQGDLVYKDAALGTVLHDVERRFGTVVVPQPEELGLRRVSVALRQPASAEAVLRDLSVALGLRYRDRADGFELFAPSPSL